MAITTGKIVYKIYRALTYGISPLMRLHLRWRRIRGREHPLRWSERLGRPSEPRPAGRLIWFHAVSLGEGLAAIPVIKCCLERRPDVTVLMTTSTVSAFEVIKERLPSNVIYQQFAPLDIPYSMDAFLQYWRPNAVMLMESELWPNLIMGAARNGIALALLNGRISTKSFRNWSYPVILPLIKLMLSKFSLILPLSTIQGIQFQLLQAPPHIISYTGDLKFAITDFDNSVGVKRSLTEFQAQLSHRKVWMASSIHKGEDEVFIRAHKLLKQKHPDLVTIIVPRKPHLGQDITLRLQEEGIPVALRSRGDNLTEEMSIYVVDTLGELRDFYRLMPIAVVGASFLLGSTGHNISEAAAAGCAVLTGHHVGHFSHMVAEMQNVNPLSVLQVSHEELVDAVNELFVNAEILEVRRLAARQAYHALSCGIVEKLWKKLHYHIFMKSVGTEDEHGARS
ncbi:probable 3-deoxy-D-manno-octulosonic acid transferase, mitochondrial isoform X3 [Salvia miltiorrhiza]|uniref:probable 3-deoxy-D-manno-octulosonic acid transferase, mitochondrial isoform X3 n=1 Tax=Salvia miltiorrhiza TaxID=226208 RepID=UPI0025AD39CE|nr:probable 3-deoxy-D-manno-octulosonic acid transferase, mitochondrial isoform X3 [Salvia miltiorrhiza]